MFGLKVITKNKYRSLCNSKNTEEILTKENRELQNRLEELKAKIKSQEKIIEKANFINFGKANENGCRIGPWCSKCQFSELMKEVTTYHIYNDAFADWDYASVEEGYYCTKHLKDICPEFKNNKN